MTEPKREEEIDAFVKGLNWSILRVFLTGLCNISIVSFFMYRLVYKPSDVAYVAAIVFPALWLVRVIIEMACDALVIDAFKKLVKMYSWRPVGELTAILNEAREEKDDLIISAFLAWLLIPCAIFLEAPNWTWIPIALGIFIVFATLVPLLRTSDECKKVAP